MPSPIVSRLSPHISILDTPPEYDSLLTVSHRGHILLKLEEVGEGNHRSGKMNVTYIGSEKQEESQCHGRSSSCIVPPSGDGNEINIQCFNPSQWHVIFPNQMKQDI